MVLENDPTALAFIAVGFFAFAWVVRLGAQVRKKIHEHSGHLHDRMDELEEAALELRKDIDGISSELDKKVDVDHLEKRISGLVELVGAAKR